MARADGTRLAVLDNNSEVIMSNSAALLLPPPLRESGAFTLLGRRAGVDVYRRDYTPAVELAAVGDIAADRDAVHAALLAHTDARIMATMAEAWIKGERPATTTLRGGLVLPIANQRDFTLGARWTVDSPVGLSFEVNDDRGANTRARNWVDRITGSWGFDALDDGRATRAIYHVQIGFASPLARWSIHTGALADLPTLIEHLRLLVGARE
jgi:hypothetical protein